MGQIVLSENLPLIVKSTSTALTWAATNNSQTTRVNVGGQQYSPTALITLVANAAGLNGLDSGSTLTSNSTYYVYAVVTTVGVLGLVASTSSVGPAVNAGYTGTVANGSWRLVGRFSTDGSGGILNVYDFTFSTYADQFVQNVVVNGNMDHWQRGTSFSSVANNTYTADRFVLEKTGSTVNIARSTDVPTFAQSGFNSLYSYLLTSTAAVAQGAANYTVITHKLEGHDYQVLHGNKFRLQFWVKSSLTGTFSLSLRNQALNRSYVTTYSISAANTWQKVVLDLTADNAGTWVFDNTVGLLVTWGLATGSNFSAGTLNSWQTTANLFGAATQTDLTNVNSATFQLAQVALLPGTFDPSSNIAFRRCGSNIGHEMQLCQRYCHRPNFDSQRSGPGVGATYASGGSTNGSVVLFSIPFPTPMRAVPTFSYSGSGTDINVFTSSGGAASQSNIPSFANFYMGTSGFGIYANVGVNAGFAGTLINNGGTAGFIQFDAEL